MGGKGRTLNLGNSAGKDVLLRLLILEGSEDALDDGLGEVRLLALLLLLLEADPAVEDGFDFVGESNFLALDEDFGFELGSFLQRERTDEKIEKMEGEKTEK